MRQEDFTAAAHGFVDHLAEPERCFRIGLFGALLTLIGDCLIGTAKFPDGANLIEGYFAIALAMPAWRPILGGAIGSSLGSSFVGQLIQREKVHIDHGIFGSPDLDQSGKVSAWLQSKLVVPLLTSFTKNEKKMAKTREKLKRFFEMNDETADRFLGCFAKFSPESIKNEYYTDLLTWLRDDIAVEGTKVHFICATKMGEKYRKRYLKYFRDPEIRAFDMQHEQWLFGGERYTAPVLQAIDEFMETTV